jgi:hypothetical protein
LLTEVFRRRFFGLFPMIVNLSRFKLFLDFNEEFLSMRPNLSSISGGNQSLNFFPIFAIELQSYIKGENTEDELFMLLSGPSAVSSVIIISFARHF